MRRLILSPTLLSALAILLCMSSAVRASSITATLANNPLNPAASVMINSGDGKSNYFSYTPGVVNWTTGAGQDPYLPHGGSFTTFCIELTQDIHPGGTYTYNLINLADAPSPGTSQTGAPGGMGQGKANAIAALWAADYGQIAHPTGGSTSDENAAAFQLDIWKIEYDWGTPNESFSSGNFLAYATAPSSAGYAAVTQAENWLTSLGWNSTTVKNGLAPEADLVALSSPQYQDQVMWAPEPSSFCLASICGIVLTLRGYWRRRLVTGITQ